MKPKTKQDNSEKDLQPKPAESQDSTYKLISLDLIDDPEQPMRTDMTPLSVEDLVMSIKQVGIIEPLVVKFTNGRYEVIAGHRRLFASRLAKIVEVPCSIRLANNEQTEMLKIHENLYRADIKPADEAKHFSYLIQKQGMTPTKISQLISKSLSYVTDRLTILEYPDFLKEALDNAEISFSVAREFARFDDIKQMRTAVFYAKRGGMTQEMARKWVQDYHRSKEQPDVNESVIVNGVDGTKEIEHTAYCIYCGNGGKLLEMDVVYIHPPCRNEATKPVEAAQSTKNN